MRDITIASSSLLQKNQRLLCAQKPHWMSTKVAYYLSLSIGSAVSFAVSRVQQEANLLA
jgi:hypothetical protein